MQVGLEKLSAPNEACWILSVTRVVKTDIAVWASQLTIIAAIWKSFRLLDGAYGAYGTDASFVVDVMRVDVEKAGYLPQLRINPARSCHDTLV